MKGNQKGFLSSILFINFKKNYCHRIKAAVDAAGLEYEEIVAQDNQEEWNEIIRITGIGMTPLIIMQEEIWLPNRDFRTPEELIERLKHYKDTPMKALKFEERINQLHNTVKNLTLLLNQMNQTISQINTKIPAQPPINTGQSKQQVTPTPMPAAQ